MHMRFLVCTFFSSRIRDFGADSPAPLGGQVGSCRTKDFLSDKDTTCSVRLNRESSYGRIAAQRLRHTVVREVLLPPLRDSDFAKIEERNKL
ncbi:hypothetical protein DWY54_12345 [Parabacteroides distasonis]|nr:hypothetical protein F9Z97_11700 [Parabacteroides distasonis]RGR32218.1 hypothetical protein DWY54_12345 [Parabacteroides distasonis]RHB84127.1 hypothetical protein DW867_21675 [Parabacteroides distasonis]RHF49909.1 hypothetical protein DW680_02250 [Parabacteroides distasonis]